MSGDNMESLLLRDSDSSSGEESDSEVVPGPSGSAAATLAVTAADAVAAASVAPPPQAPSVPPPQPMIQAPPQPQVPAPASRSSSMSQSEMSVRLKNMYSPANKPPSSMAPQQHSQQPHHVAPSKPQQQPPMQPSQPAHHHHPHHSQPIQTHQQQQQQQQQPPTVQQQHRPMPSSSRPSGGGISHQVSAATVARHSSSSGPSSSSSSSAMQQLAPPSHTHRGRPEDPYDPTPISQIVERHERHQQRSQHRSSSGLPHQQMPAPQQSVISSSSSSQSQQPPSSSSSSSKAGSVVMSKSSGGVSGLPSQGNRSAVTASSYGSSSQASVSSTVSTVTTSNLSTSQHDRSASMQDRSAAMQHDLKKQKERFLIFTRVLMKYLEQKDPALHVRVKAVIKDCADRNRRQEPGYESVTSSMKMRLREIVSDAYWQRAEAYLQHFLTTKQNRSSTGGSSSGGGSINMGSAGSSVPPSSAGSGAGSGASSSVAHPPSGSVSSMSAAAMESKKREEARRKQQQQQQQMQQARKISAPTAGPATSRSTVPTTGHPGMPSMQQQRDASKPRQGPMSGSSATAQPPTQGMPPPSVAPSVTTSTMPSGASVAAASGPTYPAAAAAAAKQQVVSKSGKGGKGSRGSSKSASTSAVTSPSLQRKSSMDTSKTSTSSGGAGNKEEQSASSPSQTAAAITTAAPPPPPVVREYSEFMEMVDHAVHFDWTTAGLMLGAKGQAQLSDEQTLLLYNGMKKPASARGIGATPAALPTTTPGAFPLPQWSRRNLVSSRVAWARVRLPEKRRASLAASSSATPPVVGASLLSLPPVQNTVAINSFPSGPSPSESTATMWHNEEVAEQDLALAAISEGAELYIKSVLEKALHCGRQRLNIDGIRLWHQQVAYDADDSTTATKPALSLCLGCDVTRQAARAAGNAALTCKRMEEALQRQQDVPSRARVLNDETLARADSMSEIALRPLLRDGASKADYEAKRSFEIYGGKDTHEPVLGRVPKKAKLEVADFQLGMQLTGHSRRQRASTLSGSFAF